MDPEFREYLERLVGEAREGDDDSGQELFVLLLDLLHDLAHSQMRGEAQESLLQTTALVNEVFLKLYGGARRDWNDVDHLIASIVQAMRQIRVDHARKRKRRKRDPGGERQPLHDGLLAWESDPDLLLDLDQAMGELTDIDADAARVAELRVFGGFTEKQIAAVLGISHRTVQRRWRYGRAFLQQRLG